MMAAERRKQREEWVLREALAVKARFLERVFARVKP